MARISEEELSRLRREVSVQRLVEGDGVALQRRGKDWVGLCPFHEDGTPSLTITPEKNLWHCFGCDAGGGPIDWVMKKRRVSFRLAVRMLLEDSPALGADTHTPRLGPKLEPVVTADLDDGALLQRVAGYYHETLKQSPEALAYLKERGLVHAEMIDRFKLGYANRTLGYRLPQKVLREGQAIRQRLQALGVMRETGHEHLSGSLVIPVVDGEGRVVQLYGRKITPNLRKGTARHLYLPGPQRGVWNAEILRASEEVIVCESLIDALSFWCAGHRHVLAAFGVHGFTQEHEDALLDNGVKRVLIAYDRDQAGEAAADKLAARLLARGLDCYRVQLPKGMDANDVVRTMTPPHKVLGLMLRKAVWLGKGAAPERGLEPLVETAPVAASPSAPAPTAPPVADVPPAPPPGDVDATPPPRGPHGPGVASPRATPQATAAAKEKEEAPPAPAPASSLAAGSSFVPAVDGFASSVVDGLVDSPAAVLAPPKESLPVETREQEVILTLGERRYRVRGLGRNMSYDLLRVNLLASNAQGFHVDTLDLYSARHRAVFVKQAAEEMRLGEELVKKDLGRVLLALEEMQDRQIQEALKPKETVVKMEDWERDEAMALLKDPALFERLLEDFTRCGVVGEDGNKLMGYLVATSRLLEEPLAVMVRSSTAAGKTSLMDAVLSFMPPEQVTQYSAMTGQSLFYLGEMDLRHKVLAIAEEEGASRASYALKLLQSEGELSIASTGKDPATGRLVTNEYQVQGPVAIFLTTTAQEVDPELLNRCLVLSVDEDREQTRRIHQRQRAAQTLAGLLNQRERTAVLRVHRNAQRLLKKMLVANPFAEHLTFVDGQTRTRRDHMKYLTLIRVIALLRQHQKDVRRLVHQGQEVDYIEADAVDIELANRLTAQVMGRCLDELSPQTRRLLELLTQMVKDTCQQQNVQQEDLRFTRKALRRYTGYSYDQIRTHLDRLVDLEYVLVHRGGRGQSFVYELLYQGQGEDGEAFVLGLMDPQSLSTTESLGGENPQFGGPLAPHLAPVGVGLGGGKSEETPAKNAPKGQNGGQLPEKALIREVVENSPYPHASYPQEGHG